MTSTPQQASRGRSILLLLPLGLLLPAVFWLVVASAAQAQDPARSGASDTGVVI